MDRKTCPIDLSHPRALQAPNKENPKKTERVFAIGFARNWSSRSVEAFSFQIIPFSHLLYSQEGAASKKALVADFMQNLFGGKGGDRIDLQNSSHLVIAKLLLHEDS